MTMVALWMVSIFSIITANLGVQASSEILMMKREIQGMKDRADFQSALCEAFQAIQKDPVPHEDTPGKAWMGELMMGEPLKGRVSVRIEDEESKINLNFASADLLANFFSEVETKVSLKGSKKDYLKGILKARYENKLQSLEEMLFLENFQKEDFKRIEPYLTVYSDKPQINPNTAQKLILKSLILSLGADQASKHMLWSRLEEACPEGTCVFRERDLEPDQFAQKLKLPKTPLMTQAVQELVSKLTVDSETFKMSITTTQGKFAKGVFRCRAGQIRPEVMAWYES